MVLVWRLRGNIVRTAPCSVVYDSCAPWYAHKYEQLLNLCTVRVRLVFVCFLKVYFVLFMCFVFYPRESFREGLCNHRRTFVCLALCPDVCLFITTITK